jgi:hypothetical protein
MKPITALVFLTILLTTVIGASTAFSQSTATLSVCNELLAMARAYQARAEAHNNLAKAYMTQIQNLAKFPKNDGTVQSMDTLFSQYDQNRQLESKFRGLYRDTAAQAEQCMKSAD